MNPQLQYSPWWLLFGDSKSKFLAGMRSVDRGHFLILGPDTCCKAALLFQLAINAAQLGQRVLYIRRAVFDKMPPLLEGFQASRDVLRRVKVMYFSDTSKFQSFIAGDGLLHIKPSLVIMEDIDSLWQCSTSDIDRFALTSAVCRDACRRVSSLFVASLSTNSVGNGGAFGGSGLERCFSFLFHIEGLQTSTAVNSTSSSQVWKLSVGGVYSALCLPPRLFTVDSHIVFLDDQPEQRDDAIADISYK